MSSLKKRVIWLPFRSKDDAEDQYEPIRWDKIAAVKFSTGGAADVYELKADAVVHRGSVKTRDAAQRLRESLAKHPTRWIEATVDVDSYSNRTETVYVNARAIARITTANPSLASDRSFSVELLGGMKFERISGAGFEQLKKWLDGSLQSTDEGGSLG